MLVLVAFVLAGTAGGWALCARAERAAAATAEHAFDAYNRYIDACNGQPGGEEWDLAVRARETLQRASAQRDAASERGDVVLGAGATTAVVLAVAFYALRWALTGRLRPWWPLRPPRAVTRRRSG